MNFNHVDNIQQTNNIMERIIEKLSIQKTEENPIENWTLEEKQKLLELYLLISKQESKIFHLIYRFNGSDCWEDIFRDYDRQYLKDKEDGVQDAVNMVKELKEKELEEKNKFINGGFIKIDR